MAAGVESVRTLDEALGAPPALLDSAAGRRQQAEIRARLFDTPIAPEHIGRFEVVRRLGAGAGGVVYLARDARLGRAVAIKVMRQHVADAARLRREAMTMARLSHPNIVGVFEIGVHEGRTFVVMELVHGVTLRAWQAQRRWPEIVGAYLEAGRGLAEAHRAGIVHRDFKPDNVMVGTAGPRDDTRVRVLDFGLARGDELELAAPAGLDTEPGLLATTLTGSGTTLGTPAYMPPEQLRSADVDARADQFAFCVALFEACHGVRPFAGDTVRELYEAIEAGRIRPTPRDRSVPRALRRVLARGLAAAPEQRWPDMPALLAALARLRGRTARRIAIVAGTVAATLVGLAVLRTPDDACSSAGAELDAQWNDARALRLRRAAAVRDDPQPWRTRIDELERGAVAWRDEARQLCAGAHATDLALQRSCLDDVRLAIDHAATGLEAALARGAATPEPRGLLGMHECRSLRARGSLPDLHGHEQTAEVAAIRAAIARAVAAGDAGEYEEAGAAIAPALASARTLGDPALLAETLLLDAAVAGHRGEIAQAEREIAEAFEVARGAGADRLALRAAADAVDVVGYVQRRRDDGERWARQGEALALRLPDTDASRLRFLVNRALMRVTHGELEAARVDLEAARIGFVDRGGPQAVELEPVLGNLAHLAVLAGDHPRALALLEEAIAIREAGDGRDHPELVGPLCNESLVLATLGRYDEAVAALARARSICDARGLTVERAWVDHDLAEVRWDEGRFADARIAAERAIAGLTGVHGEDHPRVLAARVRLARILVAQADDDAAGTIFHDVIARAEARADATEEMAIARAELVGIARRAGDATQATRELAHAFALGQQWPCSAALAIAHASVDEVEVVGAPSEGEAALVDSLRTMVGGIARCDAIIAAEVELALARVLARNGGCTAECHAVARRAIDRWRARGHGWRARADAAERWLARQPTPASLP